MTFLEEKNAVANVSGKTDGTTPNVVRDNAINNVRRSEIANAYPFSWLESAPTIVAIDANGQADLPADYNIIHKPKDVRVVGVHTLNQKNKELFEDSSFTNNYDYFLDWNSSTSLWRINTDQVSLNIQIIYYKIPATLTTDNEVDIIPDLDVITYLGAARFWLSTERDETNYDRFKSLGTARIKELINIDKKANPQRVRRSSMYGSNMGFNTID